MWITTIAKHLLKMMVFRIYVKTDFRRRKLFPQPI